MQAKSRKERTGHHPSETATAARSISVSQTNSFSGNVDGQSRLEVIKKLRKGFSFKQFKQMTEDMPLSYGDWPKILHISKRTLDRHKDENRVFDLAASERLFGLSELYRLGIEVFEDKHKLDRWLFRPNPALDGLAPKDLFDTSIGLEGIKEQLLQIEYGILA